MSDSKIDDEMAEQMRDLKKALESSRTRKSDVQDVVVELREAEQTRLELLGKELKPVFDDIDDSDERFELAITKGERPRLWIDMTSFVAMGHDKRSYRFIKDTRMGRVVLAESDSMDKMADIITEYVADRIVEREQMLEGEWISFRKPSNDESAGQQIETKPARTGWKNFMWFLFGAVSCVSALLLVALVLIPDAF